MDLLAKPIHLINSTYTSASGCTQETSGEASLHAPKENRGQCILLCVLACYTMSTQTTCEWLGKIC